MKRLGTVVGDFERNQATSFCGFESEYFSSNFRVIQGRFKIIFDMKKSIFSVESVTKISNYIM